MADYQQHFRTPVPRMLVLKDIQYALRAMGYRDVIPALKKYKSLLSIPTRLVLKPSLIKRPNVDQ
jgi:hypothetical protein